nr:K708 [uncultured bacterium]
MNIIRSIRSNAGVYGLSRIWFDVTDVSRAPLFFSALGAPFLLRHGQCTVWTDGDDLPCLNLTEGPEHKLRRLTFTCPPEELETLRARAAEHGSPVLMDHAGMLLLVGPDGLEIEIIGHAAPAEGDGGKALILPRAPLHGEAVTPPPIRLAHAAIFVTALGQALEFYRDVLGLRLSDRCGDDLAFLHGPHGGDHHVLALVASSASGLHHYSFEMGTIDAIEMRAAHMAEQGFAAGWGLGRHVLGSNFFHYVRDPWGTHAELTAGLEYIPADADWVARDHKAEDAFYLWGPPPPAGFIDNIEAKAAERPSVAA